MISDASLQTLMQVAERIVKQECYCPFQRTTPAGERYCPLLTSLQNPEDYCQHLSRETVAVLEPSLHKVVSFRTYRKSNFIPEP